MHLRFHCPPIRFSVQAVPADAARDTTEPDRIPIGADSHPDLAAAFPAWAYESRQAWRARP